MSVSSLSQRGTSYGTRTTIEYYVFIIVIRLLYDYMYCTSIYPLYAYVGFKCENAPTSYLMSWAMLIIIGSLAKKLYENREHKISMEVLFVIFIIMFIPFTTMIGCRALTGSFVFWNMIYYLILFSLVCVSDRLRGARLKIIMSHSKVIASNEMLIAIAVVSMLVVMYISGRYTHFRFNFSLSNVYDLRLEAREFDLPTILNYLFAWTKVLIPVLLAIFIRQNRIIMVAACILTQLLSFGIDGAKAPLFMTIVVIMIQFVPTFNTSMMNKWFVQGISLLLFFGVIEQRMIGTIFISSGIIRRMSFLTNLISSWYYDFFTNNSPDFFKGSFLRYIGFHSQYTEGIARMIGRLYMNNAATNANNGMIADAFANLGYVGVFIMPILMIIVLKMLDSYSCGLDLRIYIIISLYIAIQLMNSFLATAFLTGGILVLLILLAILDRDSIVAITGNQRSKPIKIKVYRQ